MDSCTGNPGKLIAWLYDKPRDKTYEVREKRKRRNLSQNAYYWVLNEKLSEALRMSRQELHFHMLKSYGTCDVMTVLEDVPLGDYFKYYEVFAHGTLNGRDYKHVRIYKRSSRMDSSEFSRLIDGAVDECRQQGIETKSPEEIARMEFIAPKEDV